MENYASLMFTDAVSAFQDKAGTRDLYAQTYDERTKTGLGPDEKAFLETRSTLYIATVSETGWPYVQHRGGPQGFIKCLDDTTIGFADYRGNRQFISQGNLAQNDRVSLFAIDYAQKARLKLQGHATLQDANEAPDLTRQFRTLGEGRVERVMTIRIVGFDWNCSQYITPRFDQDEMTAIVAPHLKFRDAAIERLSSRLQELGDDPHALIKDLTQ